MKGIKATPTNIMENLRNIDFDLTAVINAPIKNKQQKNAHMSTHFYHLKTKTTVSLANYYIRIKQTIIVK